MAVSSYAFRQQVIETGVVRDWHKQFLIATKAGHGETCGCSIRCDYRKPLNAGKAIEHAPDLELYVVFTGSQGPIVIQLKYHFVDSSGGDGVSADSVTARGDDFHGYQSIWIEIKNDSDLNGGQAKLTG